MAGRRLEVVDLTLVRRLKLRGSHRLGGGSRVLRFLTKEHAKFPGAAAQERRCSGNRVWGMMSIVAVLWRSERLWEL